MRPFQRAASTCNVTPPHVPKMASPPTGNGLGRMEENRRKRPYSKHDSLAAMTTVRERRISTSVRPDKGRRTTGSILTVGLELARATPPGTGAREYQQQKLTKSNLKRERIENSRLCTRGKTIRERRENREQ